MDSNRAQSRYAADKRLVISKAAKRRDWERREAFGALSVDKRRRGWDDDDDDGDITIINHIYNYDDGNDIDIDIDIDFGWGYGRDYGRYYWDDGWRYHSPFRHHIHGGGNYYWGGSWRVFPRCYGSSVSIGYSYTDLVWDGYTYFNRHFVYPRSYYHRSRYDSFYFFVDLGDYRDRYVPAYVRDRQRRYERRPVDVFDAHDPLSRAYAAFAYEDYFRSILEFNQAIYENSDDGLLYFARAQTFMSVGNYHSAYDDIVEGMRYIPDWPRVMFNMVEIYGNPERFGEHLNRLEDWVERHPKDFLSHFVLGYTYFFLQDYERAKFELYHTISYLDGHYESELLLDVIYEREAEEILNR